MKRKPPIPHQLFSRTLLSCAAAAALLPQGAWALDLRCLKSPFSIRFGRRVATSLRVAGQWTRDLANESTICTADSRSEVPVCITRLATLPAKSFWKKFRLCRTT